MRKDGKLLKPARQPGEGDSNTCIIFSLLSSSSPGSKHRRRRRRRRISVVNSTCRKTRESKSDSGTRKLNYCNYFMTSNHLGGYAGERGR